MSNRFARRIRSGEIDTVELLKSEFKALAKLEHPDLGAPGASGSGFSALRGEYENALREFINLRYGGPAADFGAIMVNDRRALYADLARLLARGFPKAPRHEKERARYARARQLARARLRAWDEGLPGLFDEFEAAMLDLKARRQAEVFCEALALLASILEFHETGVEQVKTVVRIELARFGSAGGDAGETVAARSGDGAGSPSPLTRAERRSLCAFIEVLVEDMDAGPALG